MRVGEVMVAGMRRVRISGGSAGNRKRDNGEEAGTSLSFRIVGEVPAILTLLRQLHACAFREQGLFPPMGTVERHKLQVPPCASPFILCSFLPRLAFFRYF